MAGEIYKTFSIDLDLKQALTNYEWRVVEGDTGNILTITLTDGGTPVDLTGARLIMLFSRGTSIAMQTNISPDTSITVGGTNHNIITVALKPGSFAPGLVESHLQISTGAPDYETLVTSAKFNFRVDRALFGNEYVMSLDSYSVLTELINEVQDIIAGRVQADWDEADPTDPKYIKNKPSTYAPSAHASSHAAGGSDEITPADIGAMAAGATPTPASHASSHATGGTDAITPADIGAMASDATPTPAAHASSHATAGADPIAPSDIGAVATTAVGAASGVASLNGNTKVTASQAAASIVTVSSSKTLALGDEGTFQLVNNSANATITIPANATVAFDVGTEIEFCRYTAKTVSFSAASGVTLVSVGSSTSIADRYGCACLKKLDTNTWLLAGDI